jgi:Spy/CpxP family protein refolding chaperone
MKKSILGLALAAIILSCGLIFATGQDQPQEKERHFLNLTPEQKTQLEKYREARRAENQAFRDKMGKLEEDWRAIRRDPQADSKKVDALIDEMASLRANHWKGMYHSRTELRKIFTPEQLAKLDRFKERMRDWGGARRHHFHQSRGYFKHWFFGEI